MVKKIHSDKAPQAIGPYSQALLDGNYLFISGQLPIDPVTGKLLKGDIQKETALVLNHIKEILKVSGGSLSNIVRCDIFVQDLSQFALINEEYGKYFKEPFPVRQTVQVAALPLGASIEISCIAKI